MAMVVGVVIIVLLLLVAAGLAYVSLTNKPGPVLQVETPKVTADDPLSKGKSNNELVIDRMILEAGLKRDDQQAKTASETLNDEPLPVGDGVTAATTVEAARLSQLQTEFIAETDRRLKNLNTAADIADELVTEQKTQSQKVINDEITILTGLKAKSAAETTKEAFLADRGELEKEYTNYLMVITQAQLLRWAGDQAILTEKVNILGGKFQERLNDASNSGESIAKAQTHLNSYQSDKTTAKDLTARALKSTLEVKPSTFNANKAVLKAYYEQLNLAHTNLDRAVTTTKAIILEIRKYE
jgi:hypothetical protein